MRQSSTNKAAEFAQDVSCGTDLASPAATGQRIQQAPAPTCWCPGLRSNRQEGEDMCSPVSHNRHHIQA